MTELPTSADSSDASSELEEFLLKKTQRPKIGFFKIAAVGALSLVVLTATFLFIWNSAAHNRLNTALARLKSAGHPTSREAVEATYLPLEGSQPLFQHTGAQLDERITRLFMSYKEEHGTSLKGAPGYVTVATPRPGEPWKDFEIWRDYLSTTVASEMEQLRLEAEIETLPRYDIKPGVPQHGLVDHIVPYRQPHFEACRHLTFAALVHSHQGQGSAAIECLKTATRVIHATRDEPILNAHFGATSNLQMVVEGLPSVLLAEHEDDDLERLQQALRQIDFRARGLRGLQGQVVTLTEFYRDPRKWDAGLRLAKPEWAALYLETILPVLNSLRDDSWAEFKTTRSTLSQTIEQLAESPIQNRRFSAAIASLGYQLRTGDSFHRGAAFVALADALIAVKRHQLKFKTTPSTLDDLIPEFLPTAPIDPFSPKGEPIQLTPLSDRVAVISLGFNFESDGGSTELGGKYNQPLDMVLELPVP